MKISKWIHFTGLVGVTMAPLANMFKNIGWFVTGSDKAFWPPMSDYVKERSLILKPGFNKNHLEKSFYLNELEQQKITVNEHPDVIVISNYAGIKNDEYDYAKNLGIEIFDYPQILENFLIKKNSIVIAGTYGKTTSTALLVDIFEKADYKPSYMIGGLAIGRPDAVKFSESNWSIVEGDEYTTSTNNKSKFFFYHPKFLLLTSAEYDHTDFFKTETEYIKNFKKFVSSIPKDGLVVACATGKNVKEVIKDAKCKVIFYELNKIDNNIPSSSWFNLAHKKNVKYDYVFNKERNLEIQVENNLIGSFNFENIIGVTALAVELGIKTDFIQDAIKSFKGIKRRLEIRDYKHGIRIIDDLASSPPKVLGSLGALRDKFPVGEFRIIVVFEPNVGNRTLESKILYKNVFLPADKVIVPRLTNLKNKKDQKWLTGDDIRDIIKEDVDDTTYEPDDHKLIDKIINESKPNDIIVFMGSHGFRGMIDELIIRLNNKI